MTQIQLPALRLDKALVTRGFVISRTRAKALIEKGVVSVNSAIIKTPDCLVSHSDHIALLENDMKWVSRAGVKLEHALAYWNINPANMVVVDVGASTGGFTDVLLEKGAAKVYALDVGHGQLASKILVDHRVVNMEGVHVNTVTPNDFPSHPDMAVIDVSFISLGKVLPNISRFLRPNALIIALIKPQFEVGRTKIKKGIVRDESLHQDVLARVSQDAENSGFLVSEIIPSPILGGDGNKEFLMLARLSFKN